MRRRSKCYILFLLAALLAALISGCTGNSAEDLYSVPQAAERFIQLQSRIDDVISEGAAYSPPESGYNRQSVQLQDLDGDGQNEAVAFFKVTGEKPLRIYIFRNIDGFFEPVVVIEGEGTAFDSINYVDMDKDGVLELVVGWQMSATVKLLTMYSIKDYQAAPLANTDFSEYTVTDIDDDGDYEVFVLRMSDADHDGVAELYDLMSDGEMISSSAHLSHGVGSISRIMRGKLLDATGAVFVDCEHAEGGVVTDIFITSSTGMLTNLTLLTQSGLSGGTARGNSIYCSDINDDGIMDMPIPKTLYSQSETSYYLIDWYDYYASGRQKLAVTTYHSYYDGWYLVIPEDWRNSISVRREDSVAGERTLVFSRIAESDGESGAFTVEDFLKIYALSGDNRRDMAALSGRFRLMVQGEITYAAEILVNTEGYKLDLSEQIIRDNFNIIYSDWITGAI